MIEGKKTIAERIVYSALDILKEKTQDESSVKALNKAIDNVRRGLEVKSRRVGGATYQVPTDVLPARAVMHSPCAGFVITPERKKVSLWN